MEELAKFVTFRISPMSYRQAQQILDRLQSARSLPIESSKEILRRLEQVHGLELNPLLVTVFAATSEYSRRDIPANITELFKKFTEMMLGRWDAAKGLAQQYHAPLKDFVLTKVAYEMHRRRVTSLDESEFEELVRRELSSRGQKANVEQLLDEMLHRSGLFRVLGQTLEFRHLLLQEFFAGRGIPSDDLLEGMVSDYWWQRAIVFYFGEHPGNSKGLESVRATLLGRPTAEIFAAATTLGLALQACYLVEVKDKLHILAGVIEGLAAAQDEAMTSFGKGGRFPLTAFIGYYLFGRDAVACNTLEDRLEDVLALISNHQLSQEQKDLRTFWTIVGLIECGVLDEAEELVKSFRPSDAKLLLALHLGCFLIQHLRVATRDEKRIAERISHSVADRVEALRPQLLNEVKSELLELRGGKVTALEAATSTEDERVDRA